VVYSTFLSTGGLRGGAGVAVDSAGNTYVTGETGSRRFPTTPGAFQPTFGGGYGDVFVSKLNASGPALAARAIT